MRAPEGVVSQLNSPTLHAAAGKDYARNTNFNCIATSGNSCFAVLSSAAGALADTDDLKVAFMRR